MHVQAEKLGVTLLHMGVPLELTQSIISYVRSFGHYDDGEICVVADVENGGYFVTKMCGE